MNIREAIKHCEEVAEKQETEMLKYNYCRGIPDVEKAVAGCKECATDHRQLAEWLETLVKAAETIQRLGAAAQDCKSCERLPMCNAYKDGDIFHECDYKWIYADKVKDNDILV